MLGAGRFRIGWRLGIRNPHLSSQYKLLPWGSKKSKYNLLLKNYNQVYQLNRQTQENQKYAQPVASNPPNRIHNQ